MKTFKVLVFTSLFTVLSFGSTQLINDKIDNTNLVNTVAIQQNYSTTGSVGYEESDDC